MLINKIVFLVWIHFIGDFILQSDWMAVHKSKSMKALAFHVVTYLLPFMLIGWKFALINGVLHGLVDMVTSRITSRLWAMNQRHWFFVVIGFDQAIHLSCLFITFKKFL